MRCTRVWLKGNGWFWRYCLNWPCRLFCQLFQCHNSFFTHQRYIVDPLQNLKAKSYEKIHFAVSLTSGWEFSPDTNSRCAHFKNIPILMLKRAFRRFWILNFLYASQYYELYCEIFFIFIKSRMKLQILFILYKLIQWETSEKRSRQFILFFQRNSEKKCLSRNFHDFWNCSLKYPKECSSSQWQQSQKYKNISKTLECQ